MLVKVLNSFVWIPHAPFGMDIAVVVCWVARQKAEHRKEHVVRHFVELPELTQSVMVSSVDTEGNTQVLE